MRVLALALVLLAACGDDGPAYEPEVLQDPSTCLDCHPTHHAEWSGSMHAYAATDPVFRGMHARGQRETNGELGLFCVNCHAPMAVARGTITEANVRDFDLATLEPADDGITCYFCHNVEKVTGDHNNPLVLAMDSRMRGGIREAADTPAHHNGYSELMDNDSTKNDSSMCGACHDIVNQAGVHVERTFAEWKTSIFATNEDVANRVSCGSCHMEPFTDVIADAPGLSVGVREFGRHDHMFPGIDQALVPFPQIAEQDMAVRTFLEGSVKIVGVPPRIGRKPPGGICVEPNRITVRVDPIGVGHNFPSGASFDRRAWLEVVAYDAEVGGSVVFQSGVVPEGMDPEQTGDANLVGFWDRARKANGDPAHFLWEVASIDDAPGDVLLPAVTNDPTDPRFDHSVTGIYANVPNLGTIQRVEARLYIRSFAIDALNDLVVSGDLDASVISQVKTLLVSESTWLLSTRDPITRCNPD